MSEVQCQSIRSGRSQLFAKPFIRPRVLNFLLRRFGGRRFPFELLPRRLLLPQSTDLKFLNRLKMTQLRTSHSSTGPTSIPAVTIILDRNGIRHAKVRSATVCPICQQPDQHRMPSNMYDRSYHTLGEDSAPHSQIEHIENVKIMPVDTMVNLRSSITFYLLYLVFVATIGPMQFGYHLVRLWSHSFILSSANGT